ncbi:hypothetical protein PT974_04520 [Cladobotryum mycophilum]|uniref:Uncharacterized protein n=1 Tax=Cladobotryum mycophilum TaxID=491253 RepID=A0ABR0SVD8_9HYPO
MAYHRWLWRSSWIWHVQSIFMARHQLSSCATTLHSRLGPSIVDIQRKISLPPPAPSQPSSSPPNPLPPISSIVQARTHRGTGTGTDDSAASQPTNYLAMSKGSSTPIASITALRSPPQE